MVLDLSLPDNYGYVALTAMSTGWLLVVRRPPFQMLFDERRDADGSISTKRSLWSGRVVLRRSVILKVCPSPRPAFYIILVPSVPRCRNPTDAILDAFFLSFRSSIAVRS